MTTQHLRFISLLSDDPNRNINEVFLENINKANQITDVLRKEHPSISFQVGLLCDFVPVVKGGSISSFLKVDDLKLKSQNKDGNKLVIERILGEENDNKKSSLLSVEENPSFSSFQKIREINYLSKENAKCYQTERALRGNKAALSNILIASMAQEHPEFSYVSLEGLSSENVKEFAQGITQMSLLKTKYEKEYIRYVPFTEDVNNKFARKWFNVERNSRYESIANEFEKRARFFYRISQPIKDLFQNKEKYRRNSVLKDYLKNKYISELTGQGLIQEIKPALKRESFLKRVKNKIAKMFAFLAGFSKEEKQVIKELNNKMSEMMQREEVSPFFLLQANVENLKKDHPNSRVDYKRIIRRIVKKQGKRIWAPYKNDAAKTSVNGKDYAGWTPLHHAANSRELLEVLVEDFKADVNAKNGIGEPVVFMASTHEGSTSILKYLKEKGANLKEKDGNGNNIFYGMVPCHKPDQPDRDLTDNFRYLLDQGVDPSDENHNGISASDRAYLEKKDLYAVFLKASPGVSDRPVGSNFSLPISSSLREDLGSPLARAKQELNRRGSNSSLESTDSFVSAMSTLGSREWEFNEIQEFNRWGSNVSLNSNSSFVSAVSSLGSSKSESGYESQGSKHSVDVPGDGNCALHAMATAYLLPAVHDKTDFNERFGRLFGSHFGNHFKESIEALIEKYAPEQSKQNDLYNTDLWNDMMVHFRGRIVDHMRTNEQEYKPSFARGSEEDLRASSFEEYLDQMTKNGTYLGDRELKAASELLCAQVKVNSGGMRYSFNEGSKISIDLDHVNKNHYQFRWSANSSSLNSVDKVQKVLPLRKVASASNLTTKDLISIPVKRTHSHSHHAF